MTARHRRRAMLAAPETRTVSGPVAVLVATGVAVVAVAALVLEPRLASADTGDVRTQDVTAVAELLD